MTKSQLKQLTTEFEQQIGLSPVEARRSAFIALAAAKCWNHARIGRYLGVHRQRVRQKLEKYQMYVDNGKMPMLAKIVKLIKSGADTTPGVVAFTQEEWERDGFAQGMLDLVAKIEPRIQIA